MSKNFVIEKRICRTCHKEYEAKIIDLMGVRFTQGEGYCHDCAQKIYDEEVAKEEAARKADIAKTRRKWREDSGMPIKFMNEEFGTFERKCQPTAYDKCLAYAKGYPLLYGEWKKKNKKSYPSLMLMSPDCWGVGKTHLVCSIAHHILNRWDGEDILRPVHFVSEPDLYRRIQATYSYTAEERHWLPSEQDILTELAIRPLLIIDDIGKEKRTDPKFVQRILFAIIDGRYSRRLPMVMTTNLSAQALRQYLGGEHNEACLDRLLEMCGGEFQIMKGESYRRKS